MDHSLPSTPFRRRIPVLFPSPAYVRSPSRQFICVAYPRCHVYWYLTPSVIIGNISRDVSLVTHARRRSGWRSS